MNEKLEQAKKEGRLLEFEGKNGEDYPLLIAIDWERTNFIHAPISVSPYKMYMLTRRTHLNPGEHMKIALVFDAEIPEMPEAAYFDLKLHLTHIGWRFPLREEDKDMTYDEVTARSEAYIAQLEADRKAERKKGKRKHSSD